MPKVDRHEEPEEKTPEQLEFERSVPGLSLVIPEVLALKPDDPIDRLVELIQRDAPLAAKVLAACNSPVLGLRHEVAEVNDAVMSLGLKVVRSLTLCSAVLAAVADCGEEGELLRELTIKTHQRVLRRATLARALSRPCQGVSAHEAFTGALLADLGAFWLLKRHPFAVEALHPLVESGEDQLEAERELADGEDHVALGVRVADCWGLPSSLREVIRTHHAPGSCKDDLSRLVHLADRAATLQEAMVSCPQAEAELVRLAEEWFGVDSASLEEVLTEARAQAAEAARAFDLPAPPHLGYDVHRISRELSDVHVDNERMVRHLREAVRKAEKLSTQLQEKVVLLDKTASTDDLTGLANRRATRLRIDEELVLATDRRPTALLLIDLDKFKQINDTYGHAAGDLALKALASTLDDLTRGTDLVGRYGGDEFVVVLPKASGEGARIVAERIRRKVSSTSVSLPDGRQFGMQVSIGGCTLPLAEATDKPALAVVDRALYAAKRLGRNQVVWLEERQNTGQERLRGQMAS